jgi:hypothetical protein
MNARLGIHLLCLTRALAKRVRERAGFDRGGNGSCRLDFKKNKNKKNKNKKNKKNFILAISYPLAERCMLLYKCKMRACGSGCGVREVSGIEFMARMQDVTRVVRMLERVWAIRGILLLRMRYLLEGLGMGWNHVCV